jgi:tetratricopeptide (TPR) repeat protein
MRAQSTGVTAPRGGDDPLAVGKSALQRGDAAAAKAFFTKYVSENPKDAEAEFDLGGAELALNDPAAAAKDFQAAIALKPDAWTAHENLVLAYAEMQDWSAFDKERALLKAARDAGKAGLALDGHDLIDVLKVKGVTYEAWYFYRPHGTFHARYVFLHFGSDGKPDFYIQCESDDADQYFFKQKHPAEAAAGDRSYSLDSYTLNDKGMTQALHQFYMDGEPSYETVRADALKVLDGRSTPAASMSVPNKNK